MAIKNQIPYILISIIIVMGAMLYLQPPSNVDNTKIYKDSLIDYRHVVDSLINDRLRLENNYIMLATSYDSVIKQKKNLETVRNNNHNEITTTTSTDDSEWFNSHFTR